MAKTSLWNFLRNKKALIVKMDKQVDIYSDWGRVKGVQYYIYQNGQLVEYRMAVTNHGHNKTAWTNVYTQQGEKIVTEAPAEYSGFANTLLKAKYKLQRLFGRRNKQAEVAVRELIARQQAEAAAAREAECQEILRRNMEEYKARLAAAAREKQARELEQYIVLESQYVHAA